MISLEDTKIIELFFERSEQAISELSAKYETPIRKVSQNILQSKRDTEECINDTYLAVWNKIPPQRPDCLASYVLRVARNIAVGRYRKNNAQRRNALYDVALDELESCIPSAASVEYAYEAKELAGEINDFLRTLGYEDRLMFTYRYWFSDSVEDIAKMLDTRANRVAVRLFRTREKLRRHLMEKGVAV